MKNRKHSQQSFSLVEVLIFVTIFSLFFIMAATIVSTTLRITRQNQDKIRATHYAEELREWLSSEKEMNWGGAECDGCTITTSSTFTELTTQITPEVNFCFNNAVLSGWPGPGVSNCYMNLDSKYRRMATFSATTVNGYVNQINVKMSVEWIDGSQLFNVPMQAVYSIWE